MSDSLRSHVLQHARFPCPLWAPGACSNSCPLRWWCRPNISSSVFPFSSHLQTFPTSGSYPMNQFFTSCGQRIGPSNEYSGKIFFRIDWLDLLALHESSPKHSSKSSTLRCSVFFIVQTSHPFMTTGKAIALTRQTFVSRVMSLLFNMLSRMAITFLPRIKRLLIHGCSHHLQ